MGDRAAGAALGVEPRERRVELRRRFRQQRQRLVAADAGRRLDPLPRFDLLRASPGRSRTTIAPRLRPRSGFAAGFSPDISAANDVSTAATCQPICAADHPPSAGARSTASAGASVSRFTKRACASRYAVRTRAIRSEWDSVMNFLQETRSSGGSFLRDFS